MAIPWRSQQLADFTPRGKKNGIVDGPFGSNLKTEHYRTSGIPIVTSGYVTSGRFVAERYLYVDHAKFVQEKRSAVYPRDIIMAKIGARAGASAVLPEDHPVGILSGNTLKISIDESRHATEFVALVLSWLYSRGDIDRLRSTGAQPAISMPLLKKFRIPAPERREQVAIAAAIQTADDLVGTLERLIAKRGEMKIGIMQRLLTGRDRLPGFSSEWSSVPFESIAFPASERVMPQHVAGDTWVVELEHIQGATGRVSGSSMASDIISLKTRFEPGDVLFGKLRAYLRKYWLADRSGLCSTEFWVLRPRIGNASEYVRYLVETELFVQSASGGYGTHMPRADWGVVRKLEFSVPGLLEQRAIADVLVAADAEMEALRIRLAKARDVKVGMMQQLLTGRIRLPLQAAA